MSRYGKPREAPSLETGPSPRDSGVAMIIVLAWSLVVLGLVLVLASSVIQQIRPAEHSENSYDALSAAEAGIEDYRARLLVNGTYYSKPDPTNPALGGWAEVPGSDGHSEFTYAVDSGRAGTGGGVAVVSTGRAGGVTRTVKAVLARRSTLDYVYVSDYETTAPYMPGAYSTVDGTGGKDELGNDQSAQKLADKLCSRHWWDMIPGVDWVGPWTSGAAVTGVQRHQNFCQWADIIDTETLTGPIHTNDIFRLKITKLTDVGATRITSSCPSSSSEALQVGQGTGGILCPETHRFIDSPTAGPTGTIVNASGTRISSSLLPTATVNGNYIAWDGAAKPYQGDTWLPSYVMTSSTSTPNYTLPSGFTANPNFDTVLQLPKDPTLLLPHSSFDGCVYTGPTRIRFAVESTVPYMYVTSPDTLTTNAKCATPLGATGLAGTPGSNTGAKHTAKVNLTTFVDPLVIYVQDVQRNSPETPNKDNPDNDFDRNNVWATGQEPTCNMQPSLLVSATGTVGNINPINNTSPPAWTARVTVPSGGSTGLSVGAIITATNGTGGSAGSLGGGDGIYSVTSVTSTTINYTASGGTIPVAGSITNLTRAATKYPYVIPDTSVDAPASGGFTPVTGLLHGFPDQFAPSGSPYFGNNCSKGDVFIQGEYSTSVTVAADNNIAITATVGEKSRTLTSNTENLTAVPPVLDRKGKPSACTATYCPMFGLVSNQFTYIYRPLITNTPNYLNPARMGTIVWPADWSSSNATDPVIDAAVLTVNQCLSSQREYTTSNYSTLIIWGSLAQKYRCPVGQGSAYISGGYTKKYNYDERLKTKTPPYLVELSYEPWRRSVFSEITPGTQAEASKQWPLATPADTTSTFANVRVGYGPATVTFNSTTKVATVTLNSAYPLAEEKSGLIVLSYDVTNASGAIDSRTKVIIVE